MLICLPEVADGLLVEAKIYLETNKEDWQALAEVCDFRDPLMRR